MILAQADYDRFGALSPTEREDLYESQRIAPATSATGARRQVEALLKSVCQAVYAATWIDGFEVEAWELVDQVDQAPAPALDHRSAQVEPELRELRELTIEAGWWPTFDHPDPHLRHIGRAIPLAAARALYDRVNGPRRPRSS